MEEEQEQGKVLHIVMFPWLAIGHLRPFFNLSTHLAQKGHIISFISSPRNLQRIPKIPKNLSHLINLISFPLPEVENLEPEAESSMDVPHFKQQLLKIAHDLLEPSVRSFLENANPKPDWIVYDYASHWLPRIAEELGVSRAFFSLFTAAFMAFWGPPSALMSEEFKRSTAEDYAVVPDWIPFPSNMAFRLHEMSMNMEKEAGHVYDSGTSDSIRFGLCIAGSDIVIFRSCIEFEPEWFNLVHQLYQKPIIPVGVLPTEDEDEEEDNENSEWVRIRDFLDLQKENSVVYVALGTEATLSQKDVHELALGLEQCGFPFFWAISRNFPLDMLPNGYCDKVKDRGMVYTKWAPQVKILSHRSVGGFLTHCGWNSASEGLRFGRVLILFPIMNDQGMNARLLEEKKVGVEIPRNEKDGSFTSRSVVEAVVLAMVGEEGRKVRENARKMEELFGDKNRNNCYIDDLVHHMVQTRARKSNKDGLEISPYSIAA
ncbi:UDP-glucuronosyl and UDP-glucosyl transferase [Handroanthus impetiginosus]|uniref:UDP-glucuronosyl and UDP-glucosyl transferase n=1 Tax=Handroanthus impetiginosus TaxID=429701 RepID=A0A2G9IA57_9LAMI|nr:UDP-glucuronosyl and UDP-glucosyl transferase [Handroanthus impetiginosus]